jgi:hypothetical protein
MALPYGQERRLEVCCLNMDLVSPAASTGPIRGFLAMTEALLTQWIRSTFAGMGSGMQLTMSRVLRSRPFSLCSEHWGRNAAAGEQVLFDFLELGGEGSHDIG